LESSVVLVPKLAIKQRIVNQQGWSLELHLGRPNSQQLIEEKGLQDFDVLPNR
jgi:hypothetical protein